MTKAIARVTRVYVAVMLLAAGTFLTSLAGLGKAGFFVSLAIAIAKAVLIAAWFMHLAEQPSPSRWAVTLGLGLAVLLLFFVSTDVLTRHLPHLRPPGT